jgi:hypothetical protein
MRGAQVLAAWEIDAKFAQLQAVLDCADGTNSRYGTLVLGRMVAGLSV